MTLFFSSPIGLGHITRDIAIVKEIAKSFNYYDFSFITGSKAFDFICIENDSSEESFSTDIKSKALEPVMKMKS